MLPNEQAKKGVLARATDPEYLLLHSGGKEENVWNSGDSLGLLLTPHPGLKSMENYSNLIGQTY